MLIRKFTKLLRADEVVYNDDLISLEKERKSILTQRWDMAFPSAQMNAAYQFWRKRLGSDKMFYNPR